MTEAPKPIGYRQPGDVVPMVIDLHALRGTHLGVIANSGAGKSGLIRKLLEVTHGQIQQIVLDPDDEYYTLREGGDYIIAGGEDGDCPATVQNAADIAKMLMETGISAVIQLNHLKGEDPQAFVAAFLQEMMETPRALWHPVLLVLDEAHRFVPQDGTTAATDAVRDLFARGRKRGFTGVLATQRMASIEKSVTANMNNWALGRVGQATDRKVVLNMLGFAATSTEGRTLMALDDRVFWMFGRGVSAKFPVLMRVADTETTIVESGEAKIPTRPAPAALQKLLEGLQKAAPAPQVADTPTNAAQPHSQAELERAYTKGREFGKAVGYNHGMDVGLDIGISQLENAIVMLRGMITTTDEPAPGSISITDEGVTITPARANGYDISVKKVAAPKPSGKISRAVQEIIAFYQSIHPRAVPFLVAAKQAGVGMKSSQFRSYEPELIASGAVEAIGDRYRALIASGSPEQYLDKVDAQLAPKHRAIFQFIRRSARPVTKDEIIVAADVSPTSSTTSAALALLQHEADVIEKVGDSHYQMAEAFR